MANLHGYDEASQTPLLASWRRHQWCMDALRLLLYDYASCVRHDGSDFHDLIQQTHPSPSSSPADPADYGSRDCPYSLPSAVERLAYSCHPKLRQRFHRLFLHRLFLHRLFLVHDRALCLRIPLCHVACLHWSPRQIPLGLPAMPLNRLSSANTRTPSSREEGRPKRDGSVSDMAGLYLHNRVGITKLRYLIISIVFRHVCYPPGPPPNILTKAKINFDLVLPPG